MHTKVCDLAAIGKYELVSTVADARMLACRCTYGWDRWWYHLTELARHI